MMINGLPLLRISFSGIGAGGVII
jgi:hypothetical protein